jgi:hypothetical protein
MTRQRGKISRDMRSHTTMASRITGRHYRRRRNHHFNYRENEAGRAAMLRESTRP